MSKLKADIWSFVTSPGLLLDVMKVAFYGKDYQEFLMCPLIKRLGRALASKNATKHSNAQPSF